MWSSSSDSRGISASSKSSSSSSSSSSRSPFSPRLKTMEEVWKDINLSSLQEHHKIYSRDHDPRSTNFGGMILQDFLARPFAADSRQPSPVLRPPMLNLNSVPDRDFFGNLVDPVRQNTTFRPGSAISQVPFEGLASNSTDGRKRFTSTDQTENDSGGTRNKRMIKNRESAARSRARKQAYMTELELEVAHLLEENARLKKQQHQQLRIAAASQVPKKNTLYRTLTAPF